MYNMYMQEIMEKGGAPSLDEIKEAANQVSEAKIKSFVNHMI